MTILRGGSGGWTYADRVLAVAHVMAGDLLCLGCGQPKHEAYNPDSTGWYETRNAECQGCVELERDEKNGKDDEYRHARKVWTVDTRPPDVKLTPWSPNPVSSD